MVDSSVATEGGDGCWSGEGGMVDSSVAAEGEGDSWSGGGDRVEGGGSVCGGVLL